MISFYVTCIALGGTVLVLQLLLGLAGMGHHDVHVEHAHEGLNLRSARAIAAGLAFFGVGGLAGIEILGLQPMLALIPALALGTAAMYGVVAALRSLRRLESDRTIVLERAVGASGTVYLTIPAGRSGAGKVHLTLQERLVELRAVTSESELPTGASVMVVDVERPSTLVVIRSPVLLEESNASD